MARKSDNMKPAAGSNDFIEARLFPSRNDCVYTSCYCEENVWHLCSSVRDTQPEELGKCFCVFISNHSQTIPLWEQTASNREDGLVVWGSDGSSVYDLDTRLDFPCPFQQYVRQGIQSCASLKPEFQRLFRVIPAEEFLSTFASDRSHMLDDDGKWLKPPPAYPCIKTLDSANNIKEFMSMDPKVGVGKVMDFWQFCDNFLEKKDNS
ncbi:protein N-terminal glutamine amidohydrolase-like isoform X2 [Mercenaria mercenaria]|uniref:protein N-terminal glutamine amidohydrolase-like isoform X2 n=1 Tax=Mercenaria mercenaria TaxID=6596 RepID=UPI001E1DE9E8|nr:protein N-terminal glutamine amidohydrolase-like isoform X2 [Mercenaria mercenaria]